MSDPLVVSIPHHLGRAEATRRIKSGFASAQGHFGHLVTISDECWEDNRFTFRAASLGQSAAATLDVNEDSVVVSVVLPWLLARFAQLATGAVRREGTLMLEKK